MRISTFEVMASCCALLQDLTTCFWHATTSTPAQLQVLGIQLLKGEGEEPTVRGNAELKVTGWKQSLSVPLHMTALVELAAESAARNRRPLGHNTWLRSLQASRVQLKM